MYKESEEKLLEILRGNIDRCVCKCLRWIRGLISAAQMYIFAMRNSDWVPLHLKRLN